MKRRIIRGSSVLRPATEEDIDEYLLAEHRREMIICKNVCINIEPPPPPPPSAKPPLPPSQQQPQQQQQLCDKPCTVPSDLCALCDPILPSKQTFPAKSPVNRRMASLLSRGFGTGGMTGGTGARGEHPIIGSGGGGISWLMRARGKDRDKDKEWCGRQEMDMARLAAMDEYKAISVFLAHLRRYRNDMFSSLQATDDDSDADADAGADTGRSRSSPNGLDSAEKVRFFDYAKVTALSPHGLDSSSSTSNARVSRPHGTFRSFSADDQFAMQAAMAARHLASLSPSSSPSASTSDSTTTATTTTTGTTATSNTERDHNHDDNDEDGDGDDMKSESTCDAMERGVSTSDVGMAPSVIVPEVKGEMETKLVVQPTVALSSMDPQRPGRRALTDLPSLSNMNAHVDTDGFGFPFTYDRAALRPLPPPPHPPPPPLVAAAARRAQRDASSNGSIRIREEDGRDGFLGKQMPRPLANATRPAAYSATAGEDDEGEEGRKKFANVPSSESGGEGWVGNKRMPASFHHHPTPNDPVPTEAGASGEGGGEEEEEGRWNRMKRGAARVKSENGLGLVGRLRSFRKA